MNQKTMIKNAVLVGTALLCWYLPDILAFADNIISFFGPN